MKQKKLVSFYFNKEDLRKMIVNYIHLKNDLNKLYSSIDIEEKMINHIENNDFIAEFVDNDELYVSFDGEIDEE